MAFTCAEYMSGFKSVKSFGNLAFTNSDDTKCLAKCDTSYYDSDKNCLAACASPSVYYVNTAIEEDTTIKECAGSCPDTFSFINGNECVSQCTDKTYVKSDEK